MTATTCNQQVLRSTATGLLETTVTASGQYISWTHCCGAQAPSNFSQLRPTLPTPTQLICVGDGDATTRRYRTQTTKILPELMLEEDTQVLQRTGQQWGRALKTLHHSHPATAGTHPPPRSYQRAGSWLNGDWALSREVLGETGLATIRGWATTMVSAAAEVLVHGSPGIAHWTVAKDPKVPGVLLTGEDTGIADPSYDVAWILGELAELHYFYPQLRAAVFAVQTGLQHGYGPTMDPRQHRSGIAYRLVQHAYDWNHYAGASAAQASLLLRLATAYLQEPPPEERNIHG